MADPKFISQNGDVTKWIASERDVNGELKHYRGFSQDTSKTVDMVREKAQAAPGRFSKKGEHQYVGSIPMVMLQDWLKGRGKDMSDWATDKHLKKAFLLHMTAENPRLFAKTYQT